MDFVQVFSGFFRAYSVICCRLGGKLEEPVIRFYTAEVALGIHDLHKMGYVHRSVDLDQSQRYIINVLCKKTVVVFGGMTAGGKK